MPITQQNYEKLFGPPGIDLARRNLPRHDTASVHSSGGLTITGSVVPRTPAQATALAAWLSSQFGQPTASSRPGKLRFGIVARLLPDGRLALDGAPRTISPAKAREFAGWLIANFEGSSDAGRNNAKSKKIDQSKQRRKTP